MQRTRSVEDILYEDALNRIEKLDMKRQQLHSSLNASPKTTLKTSNMLLADKLN